MGWEEWLRSAADAPSKNEDDKRDRTEQQVRKALADFGALKGRPYRVYVKGSYANNTNVKLDYDVDIAVQYGGFFYYDFEFALKGQPKSVVGLVDSTDPYTRNEFKSDIKSALMSAFGATAIQTGNIAFRVREGKTTLPADVVPCWDFRRYDGITSKGEPIIQYGSRAYSASGEEINNYPDQQKEKGLAKNSRTNSRYKYIVRATKKLHTYLDEKGLIKKPLPSYLIECLLFNVPDKEFGNSKYMSDMRSVLRIVYNSTLDAGDWNDWEEANGMKWLYRGNQSWTRGQVHQFADAAWNALGF